MGWLSQINWLNWLTFSMDGQRLDRLLSSMHWLEAPTYWDNYVDQRSEAKLFNLDADEHISFAALLAVLVLFWLWYQCTRVWLLEGQSLDLLLVYSALQRREWYKITSPKNTGLKAQCYLMFRKLLVHLSHFAQAFGYRKATSRPRFRLKTWHGSISMALQSSCMPSWQSVSHS